MNEKINYEIEEINKYHKEIQNLQIKNLKQFKEKNILNLAASMCLFNILNSCIEIGESTISIKKLETPYKYKEIFEILEKNKIISKKTAKTLANYMYHRNMLAHQYGKIDIDKIYDIIKNIKIFPQFIEEIKKSLKN